MHVRPAKREDLPAIGDILAACDLLAPGVNYDEWTGWLLVAERAGQVIGMIHVLPAKPYAIVTEFGVLPVFQKSRAGHKLIEAAELLLRANGFAIWAAFVGANRNGFHLTVEAWGAQSHGDGTMYTRGLL